MRRPEVRLEYLGCGAAEGRSGAEDLRTSPSHLLFKAH